MKQIFLLITLAFCSTALFAQPDEAEMKKKKEKMDAMKAAYLTTSLDLSKKEAQAFWPVYNEREEKVHALRMADREKMMKYKKAGKKIDDLSDEELLEMMNNKLDNEEKIAKINKEYHAKFLKVLGTKKTAKLYLAEKEFMRDIMKRRPGGPGGPEGSENPGEGKRKHQR